MSWTLIIMLAILVGVPSFLAGWVSGAAVEGREWLRAMKGRKK